VIRRIISGGQTGADSAALDFAIWHEIPHGGWCPKGQLCENGTIDPRYQLTENFDEKLSTAHREKRTGFRWHRNPHDFTQVDWRIEENR
jgi:hypothetical protein